jgi:hypothetical protein
MALHHNFSLCPRRTFAEEELFQPRQLMSTLRFILDLQAITSAYVGIQLEAHLCLLHYYQILVSISLGVKG